MNSYNKLLELNKLNKKINDTKNHYLLVKQNNNEISGGSNINSELKELLYSKFTENEINELKELYGSGKLSDEQLKELYNSKFSTDELNKINNLSGGFWNLLMSFFSSSSQPSQQTQRTYLVFELDYNTYDDRFSSFLNLPEIKEITENDIKRTRKFTEIYRSKFSADSSIYSGNNKALFISKNFEKALLLSTTDNKKFDYYILSSDVPKEQILKIQNLKNIFNNENITHFFNNEFKNTCETMYTSKLHEEIDKIKGGDSTNGTIDNIINEIKKNINESIEEIHQIKKTNERRISETLNKREYKKYNTFNFNPSFDYQELNNSNIEFFLSTLSQDINIKTDGNYRFNMIYEIKEDEHNYDFAEQTHTPTSLSNTLLYLKIFSSYDEELKKKTGERIAASQAAAQAAAQAATTPAS